jgi:hypothetical protein
VLAAKYFTDLNANNIGLVMAVNMGGLSNLALLKEEGIKNFSDLAIGVMFAVVMYFVFATSYIVLGIVLLTRLIVLWLALALSPIAVLVYVVPQIKEWAGGGGDFAQKVIKHLLAPVIIGATMSLGYILIDAWGGLTKNAALSTGFQVDQVISTEFLINGMDDLPHFIIALASIIIVWTGVFAAANDTYASFATEAIKGFGERVRDAALKAPFLLPTIPIAKKAGGGDVNVSPLAMLEGLTKGLDIVNHGAITQGQLEDLRKARPELDFILSGGNTRRTPEENANILKDLVDGKTSISPDELRQVTQTLLDSVSNSSTLKSEDKTKVLEELRTIQKLQPEAALSALRNLINKHDAGEELGLKASMYGDIKEALGTKIKEVAREAPTTTPAAPTTPATTAPTTTTTTTTRPPATSTLAPAVVTAQTEVAALATPTANTADARRTARANIATARGTIPATDTASLATLQALDDLITAEEAVQTALTATPRTTALNTAAQAAITTAQASATTAAHAPSTARLGQLQTSL